MNKIRFYLYIGLVILHILLSSCGSAITATEQAFTPPDFSVALEINADHEIHGSLIVTNTGDSPFPKDNDFNASMYLWKQNSELRARVEAHVIQELAPEEAVTLNEGYWHLNPGTFFLTWGAPHYGGVITVFSVLEENGELYLGKSISFPVTPVLYEGQIARVGLIKNFQLIEDNSIIIQGETHIPDSGCIFPLLYDQTGIVDGFPVGQCAKIADGQWQLVVPADPGKEGCFLEKDRTYSLILFSDDLEIPPSPPFAIELSPPNMERHSSRSGSVR
jgi:hypothetical protein